MEGNDFRLFRTIDRADQNGFTYTSALELVFGTATDWLLVHLQVAEIIVQHLSNVDPTASCYGEERV